jgi:hypothetical protein
MNFAAGFVEADDVLLEAEFTAMVVQQHLGLLAELLPTIAHQHNWHHRHHSLSCCPH